MQCTRRLLGPPGFFKRSVEEVKRFVSIASRLEGISGPTRPYDLVTFSDANSLQSCKTMCDADMGGYSSVNFDFVPAADPDPAHARFHGTISIDLPPNRPHIVRSGYAGWRTFDRKPTLFGRGNWDIDPYTHMCLRVKSDGRKYFVNVQTDSIVPTDIHQHRLPARKPGEWETVVIDLKDFVRTNHGEVVNPQSEMLRQAVRSVGVSLIDRIPKPYELLVSRVWVTTFKGDDAFKPDVSEEKQEKPHEVLQRRPKSDLPEKILM